MNVLFTRLAEDAIIPSQAHAGDAGFDLASLEDVVLAPGEIHRFSLGFATEFDSSYVALVWERSSTGSKGLAVRCGVIDSSYRGEWMVVVQNLSLVPIEVHKGDRIAQVLFQQFAQVNFIEAETLSGSERGAGWLGSSDVK
jgi:dUTP pyrophosphatase